MPSEHAGDRGGPLFEVVLVAPEIPNNTGNIGRTCVALGCSLHLVHPIGFDLDTKACRRAGLDYWPRLDLTEHADARAYARAAPARRWLLTTHSSRPIFDADLRPGDHLVFGNETSGLPDAIAEASPDAMCSLPMCPGERSLNLATAVCAVLYEGVRQCLGRDEIRLDNHGRIVFGSLV